MTPQQKSHKRNNHVNNAIFLSILIFIALLLIYRYCILVYLL